MQSWMALGSNRMKTIFKGLLIKGTGIKQWIVKVGFYEQSLFKDAKDEETFCITIIRSLLERSN